MPGVRLRISGRVQGVGFRYAMREEAARHGVRGWVRNRRDGSVEAHLDGEANALESLVAWARRGPAGAHVEHVHCESSDEAPVATGFELRPTA
jgi:acylphosphatase